MQDPIISRLHRIKGQVEGIEKMLEKEKCDCIKVVQQIQAARSALSQVAIKVLENEANRCIEEGDKKELERIMGRAFKTFK